MARIPGYGSFLSDSTARAICPSLFLFFFSSFSLFSSAFLFCPFFLPEESRMQRGRNKGGTGLLSAADAPWRRKGRDKCRLLFEKPHTLAPARHVAGASSVCVRIRVSTCTRAPEDLAQSPLILCRNGRGCSPLTVRWGFTNPPRAKKVAIPSCCLSPNPYPSPFVPPQVEEPRFFLRRVSSSAEILMILH